MAEESGFNSRQEQEIFLYFTASRCVPEALSPGIKWMGREADSPPCKELLEVRDCWQHCKAYHGLLPKVKRYTVSTLIQMSPAHIITPYYTLRLILILSSKIHLRLPSGFYTSNSWGKFQHAFLISSMHVACLVSFIFNLIMITQEYKSRLEMDFMFYTVRTRAGIA
jgi:hypothetical protein